MRRIRLWILVAITVLLFPDGNATAAMLILQRSQRGVQDVSPQTLQTGPIGPYYALIIGNDNYQFLPKLQTASNDAQALAHLLREQYGFGTTLLLNASRANILDALATYRDKLPINSNLLIYYAGHGNNDSEAKVAYWLPVDAQAGNNANWVSSEDITAELRVIKSLHVLIIADSCYSGALLRGGIDFTDINADIKPQERGYYLAKLQRIKSRNIMASGGNEPVADGGPDGHSIFAAVILQSLREMDGAQFTAASLFQRVVVRVAGRSRQTPQYSAIVNSDHDGGDFVFFRQPSHSQPIELCCSVLTTMIADGGNSSADVSRSTPSGQDVREVLEQYRSAYETEDLTALRKLWPSITPQNIKNLQIFFQTAKSVTLNCAVVGSPQVGADTATINFLEELSYTTGGRTKKIPSQKATMKLKRGPESGGSWTIDSIQ
ncbi:caspase family protein [Tunturiibacter gelidoferens]|uniref:Peptidase C14 caspase domain-containing protein n=1 Tax=Tunturiibacter lichenicola TaxID=2051959 RepID=A0A7Y9NS81_9BACT|nr:caspase family protein [Edaphobacter lichenicola]NYF53945.1 hypothetical protein [Edaphobacter lichenicola]